MLKYKTFVWPFLSQIEAWLSLKNAWLPLIFFSIPITLAKICVRNYKPHNNISVLAGPAVKKRDFRRPCRDAQNVCTVAKGGIVLNFLAQGAKLHTNCWIAISCLSWSCNLQMLRAKSSLSSSLVYLCTYLFILFYICVCNINVSVL